MRRKAHTTTSSLHSAFEFLRMRFGMPEECFSRYTFLMDNNLVVVTSERVKQFRVSRYVQKGITVLKLTSGKFRITLEGVQLLGGCVTRNAVALNREEAYDFLKGMNIKKVLDNVEPGQVIIRLGPDNLAPGLYRNGIIKNQIPAGKRLH